MTKHMVAVLFAAGSQILSVSSTAMADNTASAKDVDRIAALEERVMSLQDNVEALIQGFNSLASRVPQTKVVLDCSGKTAQQVQDGFTFDVLPVVCKDIEKYLEGHRITLQIGNPSSFALTNVKASIGYGKSFAETVDSDHQVAVPISDNLEPGRWMTTKVVINPSKPEDMRNLIFKFRIGGLSGSSAGSQ